MKVLITIFAIATMVFAFNTPSAFAKEGQYQCVGIPKWIGKCDTDNDIALDELHDPDRSDNERDVADSGEEGSTKETGASDQ